MFTRSPQPLVGVALVKERAKIFANLANGTPLEKILDIDVLAAYVNECSRPGASNLEKTTAQQFVDVIDKTRIDKAPGVKIWCSFIEATLVEGPEEQRVIDEMIQSNAWESRLLALYAVRLLPVESQKALAVKLLPDKDKLVKDYVQAILDQLQLQAAAPPPGAGPATQPAGPQPTP